MGTPTVVSAHNEDQGGTATEVEADLTDEQRLELIFGACLTRPAALATPLNMRVLPGTPTRSKVISFVLDGGSLPVKALEIPYPGWEVTVTGSRAEATFTGDSADLQAPYRFWFWVGLDDPDVDGGTFQASLSVTLDDGHRVEHVLENKAASDVKFAVSDDVLELPLLSLPYTAAMVNDPGTTPSATVKPCVLGEAATDATTDAATDAVVVDAEPAGDSPWVFLTGVGALTLAIGAAGGYLFGRRG